MNTNHNLKTFEAVVTGVRSLACAWLPALAALVWLASAAPAVAGDKAVYVQTNTAPDNFVIVFDRASNGHLSFAARVATGGAGKPAGNPPLGIPYLDSAGSVTLSDNGKFLFVVNAGDDTVSSFRVRPKGLELSDRKPTFGVRPVSSTVHGDLLYVLNSDTAASSISGYRYDNQGRLTPIPGSVRPTAHANGIPSAG